MNKPTGGPICPRKVFVPIETNYWKGESIYIHTSAFLTEKECMDFFDVERENAREYQRVPWERKYGTMRKGVDFDGAFVEFKCLEFELQG